MNKKKAAATITACGLIAAMMVGGTLAYLTDNETHTNSVQVSGNVRVDLVEPNWPEEDTDGNGVPDEAEDVVPNQEISKDPKLINTGENPIFGFIRLTVPVKDVTKVGDNGAILNRDGTENNGQSVAHAPQDLFYFKDAEDDESLHVNNFDPGWIRLASREEKNTETTDAGLLTASQEVGQAVYVFGWKNVIPANGTATEPLFDKIQLKNIIENEVATSQIQNIKVEAFAIQADNILDSNGDYVPTDAALNQTQLSEIYDIFVNQNGEIDNKGNMIWSKWQDAEHGQVGKEADINNERDLHDTTKRVSTTFQNDSITLSNAVVGTNPNGKVASNKGELYIGNTTTMSYALSSTRDGANTTPTFTTSNPEVVSVTKTGNTATIKALKEGDATVTVTVDGVSESVQIKVLDDSREPLPGDFVVDANENNKIPNGTDEPVAQP